MAAAGMIDAGGTKLTETQNGFRIAVDPIVTELGKLEQGEVSSSGSISSHESRSKSQQVPELERSEA
jgi:hypothetical protein